MMIGVYVYFGLWIVVPVVVWLVAGLRKAVYVCTLVGEETGEVLREWRMIEVYWGTRRGGKFVGLVWGRGHEWLRWCGYGLVVRERVGGKAGAWWWGRR